MTPGTRARYSSNPSRSVTEMLAIRYPAVIIAPTPMSVQALLANMGKMSQEELAEGMRFELTIRLDAVWRFSKPLPSATRPPLRRDRKAHSVCGSVLCAHLAQRNLEPALRPRPRH